MDWESEFEKLAITSLKDLSEQPDGVSLHEIQWCVHDLTEAAMLLSQFQLRFLEDPDIEFPDEAITIIDTLRSGCDGLVESFIELFEELDIQNDGDEEKWI